MHQQFKQLFQQQPKCGGKRVVVAAVHHHHRHHHHHHHQVAVHHQVQVAVVQVLGKENGGKANGGIPGEQTKIAFFWFDA